MASRKSTARRSPATRTRSSAARGGLRVHPFLAAFPEAPLAERELLRADIEAHGLRRPLARTAEPRPQLLDGRSRLWALEQLGIEPEWIEIPLEEAEAYAVSENLLRRHLDTSQRAMVAARLATLRHGTRPGESGNDEGAETVDGAAEKLTVGEKSVRLARKVLDSGDAALIAAVDGRQLSVSAAAGMVDRPERERRAALELIQGGQRPSAAARAARSAPTPRGPRYDVVLAPSLPGDEDPLPLADDGHLWLVVQSDEVPDALRYLRAQGCKYQGLVAWPGAGSGESDGVLVSDLLVALHGSRGEVSFEPSKHGRTVVGEDELRALIAEVCPGERIDLDSTSPQEGWTLRHAAPARRKATRAPVAQAQRPVRGERRNLARRPRAAATA